MRRTLSCFVGDFFGRERGTRSSIYCGLINSLSQVATFYKINLELQRTGNVSDVESESKIVLDVVVALYEKYMSWLNNNYITQGSYFEKDLEFQQEMQLCKGVAELASSIMMDI